MFSAQIFRDKTPGIMLLLNASTPQHYFSSARGVTLVSFSPCDYDFQRINSPIPASYSLYTRRGPGKERAYDARPASVSITNSGARALTLNRLLKPWALRIIMTNVAGTCVSFNQRIGIVLAAKQIRRITN